VLKGRAASLLVGNRGCGGRAVSAMGRSWISGGLGLLLVTQDRKQAVPSGLAAAWLVVEVLVVLWSSGRMVSVGWCRSDGDDVVVVG
jgi:hypothetical protein